MKNIYFAIAAFLLNVTPGQADSWPWRHEKLTRGVVAVPTIQNGTSYLVSWRMLDTDDDNTTFDVIKDGVTVKSNINNATCYMDTSGSPTTTYRIVTKQHGVATDTTEAITPWEDLFMQLRLDRPADGTFHDVEYSYAPNDCSAADADGDGEYELVVKWEGVVADNSQGGFTSPTIFDCYKLDGTKLWRIDMGHNIRSGPHYVPFLFYDFDADGKAEFIVKTAPGTIDGAGRYVSEAATDPVIQETDNTKEHLNGGGQVMTGPEFLTVFDGETGQAIHTIYYNPNRACFVGGAPELRTDLWGDDYGNRSERYLATVAYLDGPDGKASAVMCRGYYTRAYLWAVDFDGAHLTTRWRHASLSEKTAMVTDAENGKDVRAYNKATYENATSNFTAYAQGNHNLSVGDTDNDGRDEIIYGSAAIDDDGTLLWNTGLGHGDAMHVGDLMPDHPGLEVFTVHEWGPFGMHICDGATGELLVQKDGGGDTARGMAADVSDRRGYEYWYFGDGNMYNVDGSITGTSMSYIFRIYWDGDVYDELLSDVSRHNQPFLEKFNVGRLTIAGKQVYEYGYNVTCNGTKGTPCLTADLFGDWREEMIFFNNEDKQTLNIFSTSTLSNARTPCLMLDHTYRLAVAWQNVGYNQPPHLGYYLPDATQARFDFESEALKKQEIILGDSIQPVNFHYVNCTRATRPRTITKDGKPLPYAEARKFVFTNDEELCQMTISGTPSSAGVYEIVVNANEPSNGIPYADTLYVTVEDPLSVGKIEAEENADEPIYDLGGRRLPGYPDRPGIYIQGRKKIVIGPRDVERGQSQ